MTLVHWTKGYTQAELDEAQQKFALVFPPDLVDLLREKRPACGHDWMDEVAIRRALDWPFDGLLRSVKRGLIWWPEWGTTRQFRRSQGSLAVRPLTGSEADTLDLPPLPA